jgi:hypothetical protein
MALKFGSKAWRAKYLKNSGKKQKTAKSKTRSNSGRFQARYRGSVIGWYDTAAQARAAIARAKREEKREEEDFRRMYDPNYRAPKRKRKNASRTTKRKSPVRPNPPRSWTKVKAVRVVRKGGRDVLEIRK